MITATTLTTTAMATTTTTPAPSNLAPTSVDVVPAQRPERLRCLLQRWQLGIPPCWRRRERYHRVLHPGWLARRLERRSGGRHHCRCRHRLRPCSCRPHVSMTLDERVSCDCAPCDNATTA